MPSSFTETFPDDVIIDSATLYADLGDSGLRKAPGLAVDAVPEKFKTTGTAYYRLSSTDYEQVAVTAQVFSSAHNVTANKWGAILVMMNSSGTVSTKVVATPQAYNDEASAIAALPSADSGKVAIGYITINNDTGTWVANTDDLTAGSDLTAAYFYDSDLSAMVPLGGTRGGITFDKGEEWRNIPADGLRGKVAMLDRKTSSDPKLTGTCLLFGPDMVSNVLEPGSTSVNTGTSPNATQTITPVAPGTLLQRGDYRRFECIWDRGNGGQAKVTFTMGLVSTWTLGAQDNNEGEIPITIEARQDPEILLATGPYSPFSIELTGPDIASAA